MFTLNCVPNGALPHIDKVEENHKLGTILEHGGKMVEKLNLKERGTILD